MAKKPPSPSARLILERMYAEQGQGVEPGSALCTAMHEFNESQGLSNPRLNLVKNYSEQVIDFIQPGEYGLTNSPSKMLKPVAVVKVQEPEEKTTSRRKKKEESE